MLHLMALTPAVFPDQRMPGQNRQNAEEKISDEGKYRIAQNLRKSSRMTAGETLKNDVFDFIVFTSQFVNKNLFQCQRKYVEQYPDDIVPAPGGSVRCHFDDQQIHLSSRFCVRYSDLRAHFSASALSLNAT